MKSYAASPGPSGMRLHRPDSMSSETDMLSLPIGKLAFELQCALRIMASRRPTINVCHVAMADLWAGAEAQLAILLRTLARVPQ